MAILILMMGVPGSGKSTIAKNLVNEEKDAYISRDEIRFELVKEDEEYFSKENEVFNTFVQRINDAIKNECRYVFADATHLNRGSRQKLLSRISGQEGTIVYYVDTPYEIAIQRNKLRTGRAVVPEDTIKNMYRYMALPTRAEKNIDAVYTVTAEMKDSSIVSITYKREIII